MHDFLHTARRLIATALHPAAHSEMQRLLFIFRISCYKYPVFQDYWTAHHAAHHPRAEREEQRKAASERRKPALAVAHPPGDDAFSPASI
jgi:hypothetical protein